MSVVTRFAPSPTGRLHVGNIRTALVNWLWARKSGGRFLLRLDDTDRERSTDAHAQAIRDDLAWLGLSPDDEAQQSARIALYDAALSRLAAAGRVYRCYETPEELDLKRKVQLSRGLPPVYDRAALALTDADHADMAARGIAPHWRFRLNGDGAVAWTDLVRGPTHIDPASLSDPVVRRADGSYLYMLPSVVDDIDMGVTHVIRGEDHVTNSGVQLQMFESLGALAPQLAHLALLSGSDGALSKRLGSTGVEQFRADGIEPLALCALLARIGTSAAVEPVTSMQPLIDSFDFAAFGRATARFDAAELAGLSARTVHLLDYEAVRDRLPRAIDARAWAALRPNLARVGDAADWLRVIEGPVAVTADGADAGFLDAAATAAAAIDWTGDPWAQLTAALKAATGRQGKGLFMPLRRALTGQDSGPDMHALLPLIGRERALDRLRRAAATVHS